jgi:hypothetical protein
MFMSETDIAEMQREIIDARLAEHRRNPEDVMSRQQVLAEARRG